MYTDIHGVVPGEAPYGGINFDSPFGDAKKELPLSAWLDEKWPVYPPFHGPEAARDWVDKWHQPAHFWWVEQWYMGALAWAPYLGWQSESSFDLHIVKVWQGWLMLCCSSSSRSAMEYTARLHLLEHALQYGWRAELVVRSAAFLAGEGC